MASFLPQEASKANPWALLAQKMEPTGVGKNEDVDKAITGLLGQADQTIRDKYDAAAARAAEQEKEYLKRSEPVTNAAEKAGTLANTTAQQAGTLITDTKEQTKQALNSVGIEDFSLDAAKKFVREGGETVVPALKQGVKYASDFLGSEAPTTVTEGYGVVTAMPKPKLSSEEQEQATKGLQEEQQDSVKTVQQLEQLDPNSEEGKNAWQRTADYFKVPVDWLTESWKKLDEKSGGYPSGVAGLLGDAGSAVAGGASYLNDKIDFIQMLAIGAQAGTQTNNVGVAVLQGLAGGIQARQNQKAAQAKQQRDNMRWEAEQNVREYNALTSRQNADRQQQAANKTTTGFTTDERKTLDNFTTDNKVEASAAEQAGTILKSNNMPVTQQNLKRALEQMKEAGIVGKGGLLGAVGLGTDKLM